MKKATLLCGLLLALTASVAAAAPGVNLKFGACFGDGGLTNKNSLCNSNSGSNALVGSFELGAGINGVTGIEVVIDLASASPTLPAWWTYFTAGSCRISSLTANPTISATAVNCVDWANGAAAGGLAAYQTNANPLYPYSSNMARVKIGFAVASPVDVLGGTENFAFNLIYNNAKTVGLGSCAGCTTPVCILFNSINVVPGTLAGTKLSGPTNATDSNVATWQGGAGVTTLLGQGCPAATPTKNATWGSVKSLYR